MRTLKTLLGALLTVVVVACGGGSGSPTAPTPTPTPTPVPPPITIGENEVEITRTLLEFGKPGAVFPVTREISQAGTIKFLVQSDRLGSRIDYYIFFSEVDARSCAILIEGGRAQGQRFEPACQGGGWITTVIKDEGLSSMEVPNLTRSYTMWGVFKNTEPTTATYSIWGKTRFEAK